MVDDRDMPLRSLPLLALVLALLLPAPAKADINPVYLGLGLLKVPGIAFDVVGAAFVRPHLTVFESGSRMHRATQAAFVSHLVSLGLHSVAIGSFMVGSVVDADWEDTVGPVFLINGATDLAIGVMGLVTGVDILMAKSTVDVRGTPEGIGASWSGIVNIAMGTFGILWFGPMLIGGMIGVAEMAAADPPPEDARIALRARKPWVQATLTPTAGGLVISGRF